MRDAQREALGWLLVDDQGGHWMEAWSDQPQRLLADLNCARLMLLLQSSTHHSLSDGFRLPGRGDRFAGADWLSESNRDPGAVASFA
jgi:hypothetical protein